MAGNLVFVEKVCYTVLQKQHKSGIIPTYSHVSRTMKTTRAFHFWSVAVYLSYAGEKSLLIMPNIEAVRRPQETPILTKLALSSTTGSGWIPSEYGAKSQCLE